MGVFDLTKAGQVETTGFVVRAMMAVNELSNVAYLTALLNRDSSVTTNLGFVHRGISTYILRVQYSILVEAVIAFKEQYVPHPDIEAWHDKFSDLKVARELFHSVATEGKFNDIRALRNNFGFHFNYRNNGQLTKDALAQLIDEVDPTAASSAPLFQSGTEGKQFRYLLPDAVMDRAWRKICGNIPLPSPGEPLQPEAQALNDYGLRLLDAYTSWATELVTAWVRENELSQPEQ